VQTIAILGASTDRSKFGNKAVRGFVKQGFSVFPIHPKEPEIEGLTAYRSVLELPVRPNRISVYVSPHVLLKLLPDIAARGCDELWLNPGTESDEVLAEAARLALPVIQACSLMAAGVNPASL